MNWVDIVIIVFLFVATVIGLKSGIIKCVFLLTGVVVGIFLAGQYNDALARYLNFISQENLARLVAFAIIFLAITLAATITAAVLKRLASLIMLGWLNHLAGALFGLTMGFLFTSAILAAWVKFAGISSPLAQSYLAGFMLDRFPMVLALLPESFDSIRKFFLK